MAKVEITVNGTVYPCRQTMGAMLRFKRETGRDVSKMDPSDLADLTTFLWCCAASESKHEGLDFSLSLEDFADAITPDDVAAWAAASSDGSAGKAEGEEKKRP